ncbi:MAG: DUF1028 domain-containing protein [Desulfobacteraceae bacterium]|nr:DUF1028 domain-containing protein [Desulfobacteraceae bacterium]
MKNKQIFKGGIIPKRPVSTYSIVARDPSTGILGVAVQSHWFSVGSCVLWAEAGVGAVATQSFVEMSYGPLGLALMKSGKSATVTLNALLAADSKNHHSRQVGMVDAQGRTAAFTGNRCVAAAGHDTGEGFTVQANMMAKDTVWPAMKRSFEESAGDLPERLMGALAAAESEGGDIRGKQSAAILVVNGESSGRPWADRIVDLRVEDHPDPIGELARLLKLSQSYDYMAKGDELATTGDLKGAGVAYEQAATRNPEQMECPFWHGIMLAASGKTEDAIPFFRRVFATEPHWRDLVPRLPAAGLLPNDLNLVERIVGVGKDECR